SPLSEPHPLLIWQYHDEHLMRTIYESNQRLKEDGAKSQSYTMKGPPYAFASDDQAYQEIAEVWKRSSQQMKALCDAVGARYYHFLQPNQYVEGSKPMGEEERKRVLNEKSPYRNGVVNGYPI